MELVRWMEKPKLSKHYGALRASAMVIASTSYLVCWCGSERKEKIILYYWTHMRLSHVLELREIDQLFFRRCDYSPFYFLVDTSDLLN